MTGPAPLLATAYRNALRLYPRQFRDRYCDQMLLTMHDAHRERDCGSFRFWLTVFADLVQSAAQEHLHMLRNRILARPIFFHALTLGLVLTLWGAGAAVTWQQTLRRGANHPQIEMGLRYAHAIAAGTRPEDLVPSNRIDLQTSLEPFAIFYDGNGHPVASTASLNGRIPTPPAGVFDYARRYQLDLITWQPQSGVRMASALRRVDGPHPGFVLTGRSLLLVEEQEDALRRGTFITWFGLMALLVIGAMLLDRAQNANLRSLATQA